MNSKIYLKSNKDSLENNFQRNNDFEMSGLAISGNSGIAMSKFWYEQNQGSC